MLLPPLEPWQLPHCHLANEPVHSLGTHSPVDDHPHLFKRTIGPDEASFLITERTVLGTDCSVFLCTASLRIFGEGHTTGLALILAVLHDVEVRNNTFIVLFFSINQYNSVFFISSFLMITLRRLSKSYTSRDETITLFTNLDWIINTGSFVALMGASGAGKSTLLSLIAGTLVPDRGSIHLDDTDITELTVDAMIEYRGTHIGFIFQAFELMPNLTVEENIDLVLDISHAKRRYTTSEILDKVGLAGKERRFPSELSGGEQQRVAIARAFVSEVAYLLADEPTGNLDEGNATKIMELIDTLHQETKNTIIMITHDQNIASRADRIYRLQGGEIKEMKKE